MDVAHREIDGELEERIRDSYLMMGFIAGASGAEDSQGFYGSWLSEEDGLETPIKGRVFFEMTFVFTQSCGTDELDITPGEARFQDIGSIEPSLGIAGPDNSVNFVDKEDSFAVLFDFLEKLFEASLKFAPEACASDESGEVERIDSLTPKQGSSCMISNFLGESSDESSFPNPRITEEKGIAFFFATEDLDKAVKLSFSPNHANGIGLIEKSYIDCILVEVGCGAA
jgi:hypothetical protein